MKTSGLKTLKKVLYQRCLLVATGAKKVREDSKIDKIEAENDTVEIIIPDNIYSINPSFFEELFVNVVRKLGKERFLAKFNFTSVGDYVYEKPLNEAIDRILRSKTALD